MSAAIATEETLVIETPERVPLHFALASIGNRFLACAIDHAIQIMTIALMVIAFLIVANFSRVWAIGLLSAPKWVIALLIIVLFLIVWVLRVLRMALERSNSRQALAEAAGDSRRRPANYFL